MPTLRRLLSPALALALLASCTAAPVATTSESRVRSTGSGKGRVAAKASPSPGAGTGQPGGTGATDGGGGTTPAKAAYFGRVVGTDGKAAFDVTVRAYKLDAAGTGFLGGKLPKAAAYGLAQVGTPLEGKTKADGTFTFDVPAGTKLLVIAEKAPDLKAIAAFEAKPDAGAELRLAKTGTINGKVTATGAAGVKDFKDAEVGILGTPFTTKADAAGLFRLDNVPAGDYTVRATRADLGDGQFGPVAVAGTQAAQITVDIGVITPQITKLEPAVAGPGAAVKVVGTGFANTRGTAFVLTLAGTTVETAARTDDQTINFVVPATAGNGDVVVKVGQVASAAAKLTVIKSISIQANPKELGTSATHAFVATAVDSAGQAVATVPAIWTASGAAFADATGLVTAGATVGEATVEATSGSLKDTLVVKIVPATPAPSTSPSTSP